MLIWKLHTLDHRIASVRYRALVPIRALFSLGYRSLICRSLGVDQLRGAEAVIFVKAFTLKDLIFAQRVNEAGIPIVLDLCDNIFVPNYAIKYPLYPAEIIQVMARYASAVTTTGPALANVLRDTLEAPVPIMVVSDGIEEERVSRMGRRMLRRAQFLEAWRMLTSVAFWARVRTKFWVKVAARLALLRTRLKRGYTARIVGRRGGDAVSGGRAARAGSSPPGATNPVRTIIWFGHAGGDYGQFGLTDLVDVAPFLERLALRIKFKLLVVSNNREAYEKLVRPLPIDTEYVEWDSKSIRSLIKASDLTIIPNSRDSFAVCKSANRAVLALSLGVPVVATRTPAMEALEGCVGFDNWVEASYRYLTEPDLVRDHLRKAQEVLQREFGPDRIAAQWQNVLDRVKRQRGRPGRRLAMAPGRTVAVVMHLMQDFDLALPILVEGQRWSGLRGQAWVSLSLLEASPRVWKGLRANGIDFRVLDEQSDADVTHMGFRGIGAVVTIAETNQSPHRVPHRIATLANEAGVLTYTMQHGFENIGLTYSDERYPVERISFASNVIFTWSPLERLHPGVPTMTRSKCLPVGCCKTIHEEIDLPPLAGKGRRIVGIFENLHWERYDRQFTERFVQDAQALARDNPDTIFLVKPHHAGRWLTSRYRGTVPSAPNLVIADPGHPDWEQFTASQLINSFDGVITTPSTVALDAARAGKPVAVVGYGLDLSLYQPLTIIEGGRGWEEFLRGIQDEDEHRLLAGRSTEFVNRSICGGVAVQKILRKIAGDLGVDRTSAERSGVSAAPYAVGPIQEVV